MSTKKTNTNKNSFKRLRAKISSSKNRSQSFKQGVSDIYGSLVQVKDKSKEKENSTPDNYEKLIQSIQKDYSSKINNLNKESSSEIDKNKSYIKDLEERLTDSQDKNAGLGDAIQKQINAIYKSRDAEKKVLETNNKEDNKEDNNNNSLENIADFYNNYNTPSTNIDPISTPEVEENTKETNTEKENKENKTKKTLSIGNVITMGNFSYKVTNSYGFREGINSVPGRSSDEHSRGIDLVSYDNNGKKVNLPISVTAGKIINISLQGSGNAINTTQGKAGGYIVDIIPDSNPNKVIRYLHVDGMVMEMKEQLIGSRVFRGNPIVSGNKFSGSGTGPHIKIMVSDLDSNGNILKNYTDPGNDPSQFIS